jgi:hypothetical protein
LFHVVEGRNADDSEPVVLGKGVRCLAEEVPVLGNEPESRRLKDKMVRLNNLWVISAHLRTCIASDSMNHKPKYS